MTNPTMQQFFLHQPVPSQCILCGTTERPHHANNQCERCFRRLKAKENRAKAKAVSDGVDKPKDTWKKSPF